MEAVLGVDLGGTSVRAGKVAGGRVVKRAVRRISGRAAQEIVLGEVLAAIDEVIDDEVTGVGCGVPSLVDVERGVVYAVQNIPSWHEVALKGVFEARYRRPAAINNDANAFAVGEAHFGRGRGFRNLVGVTLGTGLGVGVIIDGRLYSGHNCGAGEIGSIPYRDGTIEDYAAGRFFQRMAGVGGEAVFERAGRGDAAALRLFAEYGRELGSALLVILYAYDPEIVVFGGSIARSFRYFEAGMRERLRDFAYPHALERLRIACSETEDAAILGAAALCLEQAGREAGG